MRLTSAHVKLVHRDIADSGPDLKFSQFSHADYEEHLEAFLQDRPDGPIGVFSYGSLIWKPAFVPAAVIRATARDWHRSFCLQVRRFRGTADEPGLMMQIDRGGNCEGVVQEIAMGAEIEVLRGLWRREMSNKPPSNYPRWIDVAAGGSYRRAVAFTANPDSPLYAGPLDPQFVAERLTVACGHLGSGAEYLQQTVAALEREGIHDPYLWDLQERVAAIIEQRFPDACLA